MKYNLKNEFSAHGMRFEKMQANKAGKKYRILEPIGIQTPFRPVHDIEIPGVHLLTNGMLWLLVGFEFDGASGPTYDDFRNLFPSGFHDGWHALMRAAAVGVHTPNTMHDPDLRNFKRCRKWGDGMYADLMNQCWPLAEPYEPGFFARRWYGVKQWLRNRREGANHKALRLFGASSARA